MTWEIRQGDCLARLGEMEAESVQTCVTSPPYWGLRDYGSDDQLGLEPTPEQYVANMAEVFREVRRVLRDDGTLWLNLGDSYASQGGAQVDGTKQVDGSQVGAWNGESRKPAPGLKPKDLVGIPWMVANALRAPYYTGRISDERDRIWLAAMIDAEGCMFIHRRKAGQSNGQGYVRKADSFGAGLEVSNTNRQVVERCMAIAGAGSICEQTEGRRQTLYRWNLRSNECRTIVREVYPHLVAKQHEARLLIGCPSSGERATAAHEALKLLHNGGSTSVDFPAPASMFEPGFYLRSDIIWSKLNPMPESVTDRPTKAHEYLFLLSKSARYFYDAEAVREPNEHPDRTGTNPRLAVDNTGLGAHGSALNGGIDSNPAGRNKRSVWTVATQPFPGAHFATFPQKLIEPCILAGSRAHGAMDEPEIIATPLGERNGDDPSLRTGRAGMNRPRRPDEGTRPITVTEQRGYAAQLRNSPHRVAMEAEAGPAFAHYLRTDASGARPIPPALLTEWIEKDWLSRIEASEPTPADPSTAVVLDPFCGAATTGVVAARLDRDFIGIELNPEYVEMGANRVRDDAPLLNVPAELLPIGEG